jgi:hypothetical protein
MKQEREITVIIDTGYNGALTLPTAMVRPLSLPQLASRGVTLGDQSHKVLKPTALKSFGTGNTARYGSSV